MLAMSVVSTWWRLLVLTELLVSVQSANLRCLFDNLYPRSVGFGYFLCSIVIIWFYLILYDPISKVTSSSVCNLTYWVKQKLINLNVL